MNRKELCEFAIISENLNEITLLQYVLEKNL